MGKRNLPPSQRRDPDHEIRRYLVPQSLPAIKGSYRDYRSAYLDKPVIFVCDLRDENARKLTRILDGPEGDERIRTTERESAQKGGSPTLILMLTPQDFRQHAAPLLPDVVAKAASGEPPPDAIWVLYVSRGRLLILPLKIDALANADENSPAVGTRRFTPRFND